jgi:hypothetical protein
VHDKKLDRVALVGVCALLSSVTKHREFGADIKLLIERHCMDVDALCEVRSVVTVDHLSLLVQKALTLITQSTSEDTTRSLLGFSFITIPGIVDAHDRTFSFARFGYISWTCGHYAQAELAVKNAIESLTHAGLRGLDAVVEVVCLVPATKPGLFIRALLQFVQGDGLITLLKQCSSLSRLSQQQSLTPWDVWGDAWVEEVDIVCSECLQKLLAVETSDPSLWVRVLSVMLDHGNVSLMRDSMQAIVSKLRGHQSLSVVSEQLKSRVVVQPETLNDYETQAMLTVWQDILTHHAQQQ